jgi:predicted dehydrogenase
MPEASGNHGIAVWLDLEQAPLLARVLALAKHELGLELVALGTGLAGRGREVASALVAAGAADARGAHVFDDLRSLLNSDNASAVVIAAPGALGAGTGDAGEHVERDRAMLLDARDRGVSVLSLEPIPGSAILLSAPRLTQSSPADDAGVVLGPGPAISGVEDLCTWASSTPLMRRARALVRVRELLELFGRVEALGIECWGASGQGSLGARVHDAIDAAVWLMDVPDRIDASHVSMARARALHQTPGQSLRGLEGDLTANLRYADGRSATIIASSRAGRFSRSLTLLGERGRLRVYDDGLLWTGPDGRVLDSVRDPGRLRAPLGAERPMDDGSALLARLIVDDLALTRGGPARAEAPSNAAGVLATAGTALLSARTGESESPMTILRMLRRS